MMPSNTRIQVRRGNASSWVSVNPILSQGEFGYEVDTGKLKVGDGQNAWNSLAYFPVEWSALNGKPAVIAAGSTQAAARAEISAASLDANGKVPISELPNSIMEYQGVWNASTNTPSLTDGTGNSGDVYRVSVAGSRNFGSGSISFDVGDYVIYSGSVWQKSDTTDAVSTVAGRTGDVTLGIADIAGSTTAEFTLGSLNVGHASDTTISRLSAGVIAVEGVAVPTISSTDTFTNKRVTPRIGSTESSATPSINSDSVDQYNITALAAAITSVTITGTPTDGQKLLIRIKDNGTARAIAWGSSFVSSGSATLLTTTVLNKTHLSGFIYDSTAAKWVCVAADSAGY